MINKISCLVSWSPICTHLIIVSASMEMTSTSPAVTCNIIEGEHPCGTPLPRVKRSDRRPFILVLDWVLGEHPCGTPLPRVKRSDRRPSILVLDWVLVCKALMK